MFTTLRRTALSLLLATSAASATAGIISLDGVTFTNSFTGNVLTVEIDAAGRKDGWRDAQFINAIAIKGIGDVGGVTLRTASGAANWTLNNFELQAAGCVAETGPAGNDKGKNKANDKGGNKNKQSAAAPAAASVQAPDRFCYTGAPVALGDDMVFEFSFPNGVKLEMPHLKVHFVDAAGGKVGSLLSQDFPRTSETSLGAGELGGGELGGSADSGGEQPAEVPEPASLALLGGGLAAFAVARRRRQPRA